MYSTEETAKILGFSRSALSKWRMDGVGPHFTKAKDGRIFYSSLDINEFLGDSLEKGDVLLSLDKVAGLIKEPIKRVRLNTLDFPRFHISGRNRVKLSDVLDYISRKLNNINQKQKEIVKIYDRLSSDIGDGVYER